MNSHLLHLFISYRSRGEKLIKYQANSSCVIMSVILMTTLFYKALLLQGEIWCWSLLGLNDFVSGWLIWTRAHPVSKLKKLLRINKFFKADFTIKINVKNEPRFDRSTVILKFRSNYFTVSYLASISLAFPQLYRSTWSRKKSTRFGLPYGTFFELRNDHKALLWWNAKPVVSIQTQAVKLHKNFDHYK